MKRPLTAFLENPQTSRDRPRLRTRGHANVLNVLRVPLSITFAGTALEFSSKRELLPRSERRLESPEIMRGHLTFGVLLSTSRIPLHRSCSPVARRGEIDVRNKWDPKRSDR